MPCYGYICADCCTVFMPLPLSDQLLDQMQWHTEELSVSMTCIAMQDTVLPNAMCGPSCTASAVQIALHLIRRLTINI